MTFEDKQLKCLGCEQEFWSTAGEQEFFAKKQLVNTPRRCQDCRHIYKAAKEGKPPPPLFEIECEECGQPTRVPFKPTGKSPVYCAACFHLHKNRTVEATKKYQDK